MCHPAKSIRLTTAGPKGIGMPTFKLTLQKTYYKMGFFNVGVTHNRFVRKTEGPVRIRLGHDGPEIVGRVDRSANQNGTARVMGGAPLKRWLQANFVAMDIVDVDLSSDDLIVLHAPQTQGVAK